MLDSRCLFCQATLLDVEHAKKHVLEQCEKAPWRARLAELEQTNTRLRAEVEQARDDGASMARENLNHARAEADELRRLNTPLRGERDAARMLLGDWMAHYGRHCGSCCRVDEAGQVTTPADACVCSPLVKQTRALLDGAPAVTGTTSDKRAFRNLPHDPNGKLWIGYCDLCNRQHCVVVLDPDAKVERSPHRNLPGLVGTCRVYRHGSGEHPKPLPHLRQTSCVDWEALP